MRSFSTRKELFHAVIKYFHGIDTEYDISNWDTSKITDMYAIFAYQKQISVEPIILNWDTSNVTDMSCMFNHCKQDFILNFKPLHF